MNQKNFLGYIFLGIGLLLLVADLFAARSTGNFVKNSEKAKGVVVRNDYAGGSKSATYRPVVRFVTAKGKTVEFASGVSSNPPAYNESDEVEVLYNADNPKNAEINSIFQLWLIVIILTFIGTIFSFIGLAILKFSGPASVGGIGGMRRFNNDDDFNTGGD